MTVNSYLLRVSSGYIELPEPLEIGSDVKILIEGSVVQQTDKDNQDGSVDRVYTVKGIIAEVMKDER